MMTLRLPVYDERRGRFARVRNSRVLIYWPHGLGDWAHLATILPFLEPSNEYAITRYGDDYVCLMDGNRYVRPLYTGVRAISDGSDAGARHLGVDFKRIDGRARAVAIPRLESAFERTPFDAVLYTDYPEREGRTPFPFHTKARALLRDLVRPQPVLMQALEHPLRSTIAFDVDRTVQTAVDESLRTFMDPGDRLLLLSGSGHTAARKNWDSAQTERFCELAAADSPRWKVLSFDDRFRSLFARVDAPFGLVLKALLHRAQLVAGVPAGPLHVALAFGDVPVVGIWHAHHPDWYEERSEVAIHLLGKTLFDKRYDRRPATATLPPALRNRTLAFPGNAQIRAEDAWQAARELVR